ncbi:hypothetical protein SDC9_100407 [bioreactor metagenome]|uniref:Uncharacterized protein n=1 Tax=bioreactor metagenome TaxID=1076179 RepID=A0A645ALM9_9ZZZZ
MVYNRSGQNNVVNITNKLIDPDRGTKRCITEILEIILSLGITVEHFDAACNFFTNAFDHFFVRHQPVRAQRKNNAHIFIFNAELVQFINQNRHEIEAVSDTRRVVTDKGHCLAWLYNFINWLRTDRMINGIKN